MAPNNKLRNTFHRVCGRFARLRLLVFGMAVVGAPIPLAADWHWQVCHARTMSLASSDRNVPRIAFVVSYRYNIMGETALKDKLQRHLGLPDQRELDGGCSYTNSGENLVKLQKAVVKELSDAGYHVSFPRGFTSVHPITGPRTGPMMIATAMLGSGLAHSALGNPAYPAASAVVKPATKVARWAALMIAQGIAWDTIKANVKARFPTFTDEDFEAAYRAGLRELEKARTNPNPSLADCQSAIYRAVNPNCG